MEKASKPMSLIKVIRAKCLDCAAGSKADIKECPFPDCSLYPYRLGKNPNRKGVGCIGNINTPTLPKNAHSTHDSKREILSEG